MRPQSYIRPGLALLIWIACVLAGCLALIAHP